MKANLLVTFNPVHEESAKSEIEFLAKETGKKVKIISIKEGLAELFADNPKEIIKKLVKLAKLDASGKEGSKFEYTFYWWPVDKWCKSEIKNMQVEIKKLQEGIKNKEKWKLDLAKRKTTKKYPTDIIIKLTEFIDKPNVDLKNPDKIIKVEIIGVKAAISLLDKTELFSAPKTEQK